MIVAHSYDQAVSSVAFPRFLIANFDLTAPRVFFLRRVHVHSLVLRRGSNSIISFLPAMVNVSQRVDPEFILVHKSWRSTAQDDLL